MSNPIMQTFAQENVISSNPMTIQGTVNKLFVMFALLCVSFSVVFAQFGLGYTDKVMAMTTIGLVVGFILAMVISFTKKAMHILVPIYAFCEGMLLGGISAVFNAQYPGIVSQTVALTFMTLFALLILYRTGVIKATDKFRGTVITATVGIGFFYFVAIILSMFNIQMPVLYSSSIFGIGFSLIVCVVAALNLILDFDMIENGATRGFDKTYEWFAAFGVMATLVWLYLELLRLLAKLRDN